MRGGGARSRKHAGGRWTVVPLAVISSGMRCAVVIGVVYASSGPAQASPLGCSQFYSLGDSLKRPDKPSCIDYGLGFQSDVDFDLCRSQMQTYQNDMNSYLRCLKQESDEAVDEYNAAIRKFNCLAQHGTIC